MPLSHASAPQRDSSSDKPGRPKFSICLPTLNARAFLEERMTSLIQQSTGDWELIVCDSYSNDGTWEYLSQWKSDPRVKLHQVPRHGMYAGWNECLRRATGEYVYIATADDTCDPDLLEKLAAPLDQNKEVGATYCGYRPIDETGRELAGSLSSFQKFIHPWMETPKLLSGQALFLISCALNHNWGSVTGFAFRSSLLEKTGHFRTDIGYTADGEWGLRLALACESVALIPGKLATWRLHDAQASRRWTFEHALQYKRSLLTILSDPTAGIPGSWKNKEGWMDLLMEQRNWAATEMSALFLFVAKQSPAKFARACLRALRKEPRLLGSRALSLFSFPKELASKNWEQHATHLLEYFGAEWPPAPLSR